MPGAGWRTGELGTDLGVSGYTGNLETCSVKRMKDGVLKETSLLLLPLGSLGSVDNLVEFIIMVPG